MPTTSFYDTILATMPAGLERQVFSAMRTHVGKENAITLEDLTQTVMGKVTETTKRQIREAIEVLRGDEYRIAVLANSGMAGRYLPASYAERDEVVDELVARRNSLDDIIRGLRQAKLPPKLPSEQAQQPSFF